MSLPTAINVPANLIGSFSTERGKNYKATIEFPNEDGGSPWEVGLLLFGATSEFISSVESPQYVEFVGTGGDVICLFFLSTTFTSNADEINIGWLAGENNSFAGAVKIEEASGSSSLPGGNQTEVPIENFLSYPMIANLQNWPARNGYTDTVKLSVRNTFQEGAFVAVLNEEGDLVGIFSHEETSPVYCNLLNNVYLASFLKTKVTGNGQFKFQIGDPRTDGSMKIEEV